MHKRFLTIFGIFDYNPESKLWKLIHRFCLVGSRYFLLYFGCCLQYLALLQYHSVEQITTIISVGTSYFNMVVKDAVFAWKRDRIAELWHRLDDVDFKAKGINERRHLEDARQSIRKAEIYVYIFMSMVVVFNILPGLVHILPALFYMPFDPYATASGYILAYSYITGCTLMATIICLSINIYMYVVLICLSFNYELLGERAQCVGCRHGIDKNRPTQLKADVYEDLIALIRLQLKINQ